MINGRRSAFITNHFNNRSLEPYKQIFIENNYTFCKVSIHELNSKKLENTDTILLDSRLLSHSPKIVVLCDRISARRLLLFGEGGYWRDVRDVMKAGFIPLSTENELHLKLQHPPLEEGCTTSNFT